ncbi:hypothetical protein SUNI508_05442 [Seiridium unicorne]|uniref:Uncharacterized protein n=1 Tax=Seiridium unicorne TaxID=138068 RepID=A0ABR2V5M0_9PEZI
MRFNISLLFAALAATTQIATAAPAPAPEPASWNGKGAEAGYKVGAVACGAGALICNSQGYTVGQYTLGTGAFCCSTAAAAVTASQSAGWVAAWNAAAAKLGDAAEVVSGAYAKVGQFVAQCTATVCTMVSGNNPVSGLPTRSIDGPPPVEKNLVARSAQPEMEFGEDSPLLSRYADSESDAE